MNIISLPLVGQMYLPFLLTSMIIGMVILILIERRKAVEKEAYGKTAVVNTALITAQTATLSQDTSESAAPRGTEDAGETHMKTTQVQEVCGTPVRAVNGTVMNGSVKAGGVAEGTQAQGSSGNLKLLTNGLVVNRTAQDVPTASSSSSCSSSPSSGSGSEEEVNRRPRRVLRLSKKKHSCKGSAITCATKRKVTAVTLMTDTNEEEVKVALDLAGEIRDKGVTCTILPACTSSSSLTASPNIEEPSHVLLLFGTSEAGCRHLRDTLVPLLTPPPPQPFLFSVACWSDVPAGDVYKSAQELKSALAACGGAEWLPFACITSAENGNEEPPVTTRHQYVTTVMDKLTKPGKKCCGTSCSSKPVDIEDLATSLLLSSPPVQI